MNIQNLDKCDSINKELIENNIEMNSLGEKFKGTKSVSERAKEHERLRIERSDISKKCSKYYNFKNSGVSLCNIINDVTQVNAETGVSVNYSNCKIDCMSLYRLLFVNEQSNYEENLDSSVFIFDIMPRCITQERKCKWIVPLNNIGKCKKHNDIKKCTNDTMCKWDKYNEKCIERGQCYDRCINKNGLSVKDRKISCNEQKIKNDLVCVYDEVSGLCGVNCPWSDNQDKLSLNIYKNGRLDNCNGNVTTSTGEYRHV